MLFDLAILALILVWALFFGGLIWLCERLSR
jgi:hypothetical protein